MTLALAQPLVTSSPPPSRLPCLDHNRRYTGCIGRDRCSSPVCWDGRSKGAARLPTREVVPSDRRTCRQCATCENVIDAPGERLNGRVRDSRLVGCKAGQWTGLCSIYNLVHWPDASQRPCPRLPKVLQGNHLAARSCRQEGG